MVEPTIEILHQLRATRQPHDEARTAVTSLVIDPSTVCFGHEPTKIKTHPAFSALALDVLAEQVGSDVLGHLRPAVHHRDLEAHVLVVVPALRTEDDLALLVAVARRVAEQVVEHAL